MRALIIGRYIMILTILCGAPSVIAYEYELAVCAIFQNEARFLKEWIEFYKLIGVQKFYLYDHNSTDNYKEVLKPYIQTGEVDLTVFAEKFHFPAPQSWQADQYYGYDDCLKRVRGKVQWLAVLDVDEFLFPTQQNNLRILLKDYEQCAGVCVSWLMFGTSFVDKVPDNKLMIESLTMRAFDIRPEIKSIIQPDKIIKMSTHMPLEIVADAIMVYADKTPLIAKNTYAIDSSIKPSIDILRINHYWTKDKEFLYNVKIPRIEKNYSWIKEEKTAQVLQWAEGMNAVQDVAIQRFVKPLRQAMGL